MGYVQSLQRLAPLVEANLSLIWQGKKSPTSLLKSARVYRNQIAMTVINEQEEVERAVVSLAISIGNSMIRCEGTCSKTGLENFALYAVINVVTILFALFEMNLMSGDVAFNLDLGSARSWREGIVLNSLI